MFIKINKWSNPPSYIHFNAIKHIACSLCVFTCLDSSEVKSEEKMQRRPLLQF